MPVSIRAVARIVSQPPSSMLRAAPKKRFGFCMALESRPPESSLPPDGRLGVVRPGQAGDRVEQDDHVAAVLDQALGLFQGDVADVDVLGGRLVERAGHHLGVRAGHRAHHVGHFFGPLVDEQHDQVAFGMVLA